MIFEHYDVSMLGFENERRARESGLQQLILIPSFTYFQVLFRALWTNVLLSTFDVQDIRRPIFLFALGLETVELLIKLRLETKNKQ